MRPNLINRLKEEWNNLDPVDPLRGLLSDAIDALALVNEVDQEQPAQQQKPVAAYGYCPECGAKGVMRERRPNGNDKCANGHVYPSNKAAHGIKGDA